LVSVRKIRGDSVFSSPPWFSSRRQQHRGEGFYHKEIAFPVFALLH
jgi:hypothetical protein